MKCLQQRLENYPLLSKTFITCDPVAHYGVFLFEFYCKKSHNNNDKSGF